MANDLRNIIQAARGRKPVPQQSSGFGWGGLLAKQLAQKSVAPSVAPGALSGDTWQKFGMMPTAGFIAPPGGYDVPVEPYPGMTTFPSAGSAPISGGEELKGPRIFPTSPWAGTEEEGTDVWGNR